MPHKRKKKLMTAKAIVLESLRESHGQSYLGDHGIRIDSNGNYASVMFEGEPIRTFTSKVRAQEWVRQSTDDAIKKWQNEQ
jgi:hypothetical protein